MLASSNLYVQPKLFEIQESDDFWLEEQVDLVWYHVLKTMDWKALRPIATQYYQALYDFNIEQAEKTMPMASEESQYEGTLRLLESRATESDDLQSLHPVFRNIKKTPNVDEASLEPGVVPLRMAGRQPKCFFALFKAFMGLLLKGRAAEPETVHEELRSNPSFARICGFTLPHKEKGYRRWDIPTLRKLQQFDQIMSERGLWGHAAVDQVKRNLDSGNIKPENTLVHDTTHYDAWSSRHTVNLENEDGKARRKSQSATIKECRCTNRGSCPHPWVSSDEGAGTVTKTGGEMHWAHKASTFGLPGQSILVDAIAMSDAASHDSTSLVPHLARVFELYPVLKNKVKVVLDDGAADDAGLKLQVKEELGPTLLTPVNPRGRSPLSKDLARGLDHITPSGTPVCQEGFSFSLLGVRNETDKFIFTAPKDENGIPVCQSCPKKDGCFRGKKGARRVEIGFEQLPWLDPRFPQKSIRFQKIMANRTAIERLHKIMKYDCGSYRLTKRGNLSFQATLDKTLLAMHLLVEHK